jgi:hypothetical protein
MFPTRALKSRTITTHARLLKVADSAAKRLGASPVMTEGRMDRKYSNLVCGTFARKVPFTPLSIFAVLDDINSIITSGYRPSSSHVTQP